MKLLKGSRWLILLLVVAIIGITALGMTGGGQQNIGEMLMTYFGPHQNVLIDNNYSFQSKDTTGVARSLLTLLNTHQTRLNAMGGKDIIFTVGGVEKMRIKSNGKVGIGTIGDSVATLKTYSATGNALHGYSDGSGTGSAGTSISGTGIYGSSTSNTGVYGYSNTGKGVYGQSVSGHAGYFDGYTLVTGDLSVYGQLTKGTDLFKIDHPLDPENKYLQHSVVESPDIKNIYDGNVILDDKGEAQVDLPLYFEALNREFRYQLTCIGGYAPVYVAEKISSNHFKIAGGKAGLEISWQVTGIRQDAFANAHPIVVEQEKPAKEKGLYLHPKEWGQPEEKGISAALNN